ncbi:D-alanyl-lipoteichoic acid biosynthesis protein DltB [Streptococcus catagoni]|uniref:D-alanyl-lipoteichoic acid biosynthesis protein DltB n=1 Tax=Streptococcus catagoni TaxID=2654874 RepID=UPI001408E562|nr:D-alanyl-lipoteichoic acid biosynthesis protein DltB [Streptococcus catagoni]
MNSFFMNLPYVEPYANPQYLVYLVLLLIPIIIGIFRGVRLALYEFLVSFLFILLMFSGENSYQFFAFIFYIVWQTITVFAYRKYREKSNGTGIYYLAIFSSLFPLLSVKLLPIIPFLKIQSLFSFLGISYLTFKSLAMIIEIRDGTLKDFSLKSFMRFMIFMPTLSSGPIDRFKRFEADYNQLPDKDEYLKMLEKAIMYLMLGCLYKFILSYYLGSLLLPLAKNKALMTGGYFNTSTIAVMYFYGLNLFFDFAGYSMFAIAISYVLGIKTPENFDKPFLSTSLKDFWNRWHMTLSFWFRDYVFMRLVHTFFKHKTFKNRITISNTSYLINMLLMGFWHGITWYYIAYGLFHGVGLILTDKFLNWKKSVNRNRKKLGKKPIFTGKIFYLLSIILTFHIVMFSLLIFSGFLNDLWFVKVTK